MVGEPFFSSISILLNPAKFHAKYVSQQIIWNESITACQKKECLTCLRSHMPIQLSGLVFLKLSKAITALD